MRQNNALQVYYAERLVGTLAMTADHKAAFQYDDEWLEHGFSISPFSLPLKKQVFVPQKDYFDGLFGVFADSLPDNWGRLLLNRLLRSYKQNPDELTVLNRLAIVGKSGMGALTYYPEKSFSEQQKPVNLDELARDDHSKNFTYLYDEINDQWRLSPAYDLTYSNTYYGEHTTTVDGNGRNPGRKELLAVGIAAGMRKSNCERIIDTIQVCVSQMLGEYL